MTQFPKFSVIIPAYNEEAVIARCLAELYRGAPSDDSMEVIVAANGCNDATVEIANAAAPRAQVIDLPHGSKTGAINAANAIASHYPRIYLDADVECSYAAVSALVEALREAGCMVAAPAISLDLARSDWLIKAYYRVWMKQPFASSGNGGAGCYAMSKAAHEFAGNFPDIIGDDIWIHTRFSPEQKRFVTQTALGDPVFSTVHPPQTAIQQIRVEARRQIGNAEVLRLYPSEHEIRPGAQGGLLSAIRNGCAPGDIIVHFGMKIVARILASWSRWRGQSNAWTRDLSSRQA
uniref:glycosyltransferase family 2 protein n=1 Tax=uncultured Erythrobacter sp. TaxID=263913 RepID=UPI00260A897F|nr:glycosyltransferase [uncultured Erythrobacter sp.]